ncbi:MAG: glutamine synthetase beta-grasp domain-containing protein [Bacteroidota bacterium]
MANYKFEYIWLDGYTPTANLRSKTKVISMKSFKGDVKKLPNWSFDGSSTQQAEGHASDCMLKPVRVYRDKARRHGYFVICEVMNADGSPHKSNTRARLKDKSDYWFGFEQEYVLMEGGLPLGFPELEEARPQGEYYCGVGNGNVDGRQIVEEHLDACLDAGLSITGINAEVMLGQWEYQCFGKGAHKACDDLIMSRYLLYRTCESYGVDLELHPKPMKGDWNGSGMHTNFSNKAMREKGGKDLFMSICEAFRPVHQEHIAVYGASNDERLTGLHETQSIDKFSYGVSDRGASIRIPLGVDTSWKGYLEDRRPASNADPYLVTARIIQTVEEGMKPKKKSGKKKASSKKKTSPKKKSTPKKSSVKKVAAKKSVPKKIAVTKPTPKKAAAPKKTTPKKTVTKPKAPKQPDDLKVVEGIGPKIESLLHAAGIKTYAQLARASQTRLKKVLEDAGSRYRMHDPGTWPEQSALARSGKWDELNKLKVALKGGRK